MQRMSTPEIRELRSRLRRLEKAERKKKGIRLGYVQRKGIGCQDRDEQEKIRRGYTDPSSYVRRDGSEKLVGEDWRRRVEELSERSGGRCEREGVNPDQPRLFLRCSRKARDPHHKVKRSVRRDDRLSNLEALCEFHHDELDPRKPRWTQRESAAERREQA
jgi:hypothetical protein